MIPPNPYPAPGPSVGPQAPNYADTYPALGLSGLAQGFTHGLELGHEWGHQADELSMRGKQMENEADYRNALIGSRAPLIQSEIGKNNALAGAVPEKLALMTKSESDRDANAKAALAAKTAAAGGKAAKVDQPMDEALTQYQNLLDQTKDINRAVLAAQSIIPGTLANQLRTAQDNVAMMIPKRFSGRSNMPEIEMTGKGMSMIDPYGVASQKIQRLRQLTAAGSPAPAADPHAQAVAWAQANPKDPRSAAILKINGQL